MKKFFNYLCDGKTGVAFLSAYLLILIVNGLKMLFLFNMGSGDAFYKAFKFITQYLTDLPGGLGSAFSFFGFISSFYFVILFPIVFLITVSLYGAILQLILHATMKAKPKRFSVTLSILFTAAGFLYILKLLPILGSIIFSGAFIYLAGSVLAQKNLLPKWKGIALAMLPLVFVSALAIFFIFSILGTASFF